MLNNNDGIFNNTYLIVTISIILSIILWLIMVNTMVSDITILLINNIILMRMVLNQ